MSQIPLENTGQASYWTSPAGENWIRFQGQIDELFRPITSRLVERAGVSEGERVIDVGCGTGSSTMALADATGPTGEVIGIDISDVVIGRAMARQVSGGYDHVTYLSADAQTHGFAPGHFDLLAARFGTMFFADPVGGFANLRKALRPGGRVEFVCWAAMSENPWFLISRAAAIDVLGSVVPTPPRARGPFAFAEIDYVEDILTNAGFTDVKGTEEPVDLVVERPLEDVAAFASNIGAAARIIDEHNGTEAQVEQIAAKVAVELAQYYEDDRVRVPGLLNFFSATNNA